MGLDTVELILSYEKAFGIEIPDAMAETMQTPRDVIDYVMLHQHGSLSREQIAETVKSVTCEYCNPKDYREDAHFARDLGLD